MRPPNVLRRVLELRLHGYPALAIDGAAVPLRLKRGLALLALLVSCPVNSTAEPGEFFED